MPVQARTQQGVWDRAPWDERILKCPTEVAPGLDLLHRVTSVQRDVPLPTLAVLPNQFVVRAR